MIPVHRTYEEDRVGQPTREARDNDLTLEHSFQQGLSLEPTPWPWIVRRDTFHSLGYSQCQLRMTLGEAGMRDAAEQLVDGQGPHQYQERQGKDFPGDRVINIHNRWEEYPGSHVHGLIPVRLVDAHSMERLGWE